MPPISDPASDPASEPSREPAPSRVVIDRVTPQIDGSQFAIKRTIGETVQVAADVFADGHEVLSGVVRYRPAASGQWEEASLTAGTNDTWTASFVVQQPGYYEYTVQAWIDAFATWRRDLRKRVDAGQDVKSELLEGAVLVGEFAE